MEDELLNQGDCGCSNTEYRNLDNNNRLNENSYFAYFEKLNGPDANGTWEQRFKYVKSSNKLNGPDESTSWHHNGELKTLPINFRDWPLNENGILTFRDYEHFEEYYDYLESMSNMPPNGMSQEDFYNIVESRINFISLRQVTDDAFKKLNEIGWQNPEDIPDRHFISDSLFRSFLNENEQVKIGSNITRFVNKSIALTTSSSDQALTSVVRQLPFSTSLEDIKQLLYTYDDRLIIEDWKITTSGTAFGNNRNTRNPTSRDSGGPIPDGDMTITLPGYKDPLVPGQGDNFGVLIKNAPSRKDDGKYQISKNLRAEVKSECYAPMEVLVSNLILYVKETLIASTKVDAIFKIDWGDSRSPATVPSTAVGVAPSATHTYYTKGEYTITVFVATTSDPYHIVATEYLTISIGCHRGMSRETDWHYKTRSDGYRRVYGKHWIIQWHNGLGKEKCRIGARSEAFHWKDKRGKWAWRTYDGGRLHQYIWIKRFKANCTLQDEFIDSHDGGSYVSTTEANFTSNGFVGWDELKSRHELYTFDDKTKFSQTILDIITKPCEF